MPTLPGGAGWGAAGSSRSVRRVRTWLRRSTELKPICRRTYWLVSIDSNDDIEVRYALKATKAPIVIAPLTAIRPPATIVITRAIFGNWESSGWKRAVSFAARIFTAYR